jgi:hypothetical protein
MIRRQIAQRVGMCVKEDLCFKHLVGRNMGADNKNGRESENDWRARFTKGISVPLRKLLQSIYRYLDAKGRGKTCGQTRDAKHSTSWSFGTSALGLQLKGMIDRCTANM